MPKRTDLNSILIIGSGPIVIGQACEFDYSGTQACRVLKEEGYRVVLANSNPATIMTDPDFADATYIEPLTWEVVSAIIDREQPDAVLPTLGGQTGLNLAMELFERGLIGVPGKPEMIGANAEAIDTAENRNKFKIAMTEIGLESCRSEIAHTMGEAYRAVKAIGLPITIRSEPRRIASAGVRMRAWSSLSTTDQAGRTPGVRRMKSGPKRLRTASTSLPEQTTPAQPAFSAISARFRTRSVIESPSAYPR